MQIHGTKMKSGLKNKGGTLVELLVVITLSAMIGPVVSRLFVITLREIPLEQKLIMTNIDKNRVLNNIQQDVENSAEVLAEFGGYKTDANNLLIKTNDEEVTLYRLEKEAIDKIIVSENSSESIDKRPLPGARIRFNALSKNGKIYAVEVCSYMEQELSGHNSKKMKMQGIYFVNSMQKELYK